VTPYAGETLRGAVVATYLRGTKVAERGSPLATDLGQLV
jgi:allantoinase